VSQVSPRSVRTPRLPTFLLIGAMKAGTTSLHEYLAEHPQIFMCRPKEPNFFCEAHNWHLGRSWYEGLFAEASDAEIAVGESSTAYSQSPRHPGVPERIASLLPDVRLIYLVRHPIERIRSQYLHTVAKGNEHDRIDTALRANPMYVDLSRYALQIEQYLDYFDRDRLLILDLRELRDDRLQTMRRVFEFLGVESSYVPRRLDLRHNVSAARSRYRRAVLRLRKETRVGNVLARLPVPVKRFLRPVATKKHDTGVAIPDAVRRELEERLREDVRRLRTYLSPNFDGWGLG